MPSKKKKGKGSKLARMSEEEKLRYLQHRAEIELEARRRKQQLIAAFTKNKLKRENAFSRLNIAKINEHWRFQLRQIKCKELYDNLEYLWKYFDTALRAKNAVINELYEKLNTADIDHRKLQATHIKMMDKFINSYQTRLNKLHECYMKSIMEIKFRELGDIDHKKKILHEGCKLIEIVTYTQNISIDNKLIETKVKNAINTNTIEYSKEEDRAYVEEKIGGRINCLRTLLNDIINDYQHKTKDEKKHHDSLVQQDIAHQNEVACFPGLQLKLTHTIESLKYHKNILILTQEKTVSELENQIMMTNKHIFEIRQDLSMNQALDKVQLKKQTIVSNKIIGYLERLKQKSFALVQLMNMSLSFERQLSIVNEYNIYCSESSTPKHNACCAITPYEKLEKFWKQYNCIKTKNIFMKIDQNQLIIENNKLCDCLRSYLITIAKVANTKSPNYNSM